MASLYPELLTFIAGACCFLCLYPELRDDPLALVTLPDILLVAQCKTGKDAKQMQHFLGVPAVILVAILGSLCCLLLAIGCCKAAQLLRSPVLPDVIPRVGSQSCHCGQRVVARDSTVKANSCVSKLRDFTLLSLTKKTPPCPPPNWRHKESLQP